MCSRPPYSTRPQIELMGRGGDGPFPAASGTGDGPSPPRLTRWRKAQSITVRSLALVFIRNFNLGICLS